MERDKHCLRQPSTERISGRAQTRQNSVGKPLQYTFWLIKNSCFSDLILSLFLNCWNEPIPIPMIVLMASLTMCMSALHPLWFTSHLLLSSLFCFVVQSAPLQSHLEFIQWRKWSEHRFFFLSFFFSKKYVYCLVPGSLGITALQNVSTLYRYLFLYIDGDFFVQQLEPWSQ
jgi:hypothetical protein